MLGQGEEVLMQGEHSSVERPIMCVSWDHARVLLHAVPVSCREGKKKKDAFKSDIDIRDSFYSPTSTITDGLGLTGSLLLWYRLVYSRVWKDEGNRPQKVPECLCSVVRAFFLLTLQ